MQRYANGKVYKLVNDVDSQIYVGSSCLLLPKRFYKHKLDAKRERCRHRHVYKHLNAIGWEHVHIILIESFSCANKMELEKRERYWVDLLQPALNMKRPRVSEEERKLKVKEINSSLQNRTRAREYKRTAEYKQRRMKYKPSAELIERRQTQAYKEQQAAYYRIKNNVDYHCDICNKTVKNSKLKRHRDTNLHALNQIAYMDRVISRYSIEKP